MIYWTSFFLWQSNSAQTLSACCCFLGCNLYKHGPISLFPEWVPTERTMESFIRRDIRLYFYSFSDNQSASIRQQLTLAFNQILANITEKASINSKFSTCWITCVDTTHSLFFSYSHKMAAVPIRSIEDKTAKVYSTDFFICLCAVHMYCPWPRCPISPQTDCNYKCSLGPTQHITYLWPNDRLHNLKNGGLWDCSWMHPPPPPPEMLPAFSQTDSLYMPES